ncbi:MAG: putative DNA-binding transcriptional regulator YafY, partial [Bacteroidia bacterium]
EKLGKHVDLQLRNNDHAKIGSFISFEESTADGGTKFIDELLQHIRLQTVIVIDYFSFSSQSQKSHVFHPYFLKEYRNRWYVVGYHQEYQGLRTLALERIKSIQPDYQTPYKASNFDSNSYYNNALGVSITSNHPERVILLVDETQWRYLQSQPMHHSQQLVGNIDSWYELSFMLISNYELVSTILAMGSAVRVLEPPALKEQVALEIKRMYNNVK